MKNTNDRDGEYRRGMFRLGMNALGKVTFVATIVACGITVENVHAEIPEMAVFANAQELSDDVLGETRGKFVAHGKIMNFGVKMVTEWVTPSGEVINAAADLTVNLAHAQPQAHFQPSITIQQVQPAAQVAAQGNNTVSGSKGLDGVTGVVQSIQVAGNANGIGNVIGVSVKQSADVSSSQTQQIATSTTNMDVVTPAGNTASVALDNNGLSVAVNVVDQGQTMQAIKSVAQGNGQVLQSVKLGGDLNQIRNMINLNIQTRTNSGMTSANSAQLLSVLRQIPNAPLF